MHDPNSYSSVGWLLVALAALAMGINQVMGLVDRFKEKPPVSETYATIASCNLKHEAYGGRLCRVEGELEMIRKEMRDDRETLMQADEERSVQLHNRLNGLERVSASTEAVANSTSTRVTMMDQKMDTILMRLPKK